MKSRTQKKAFTYTKRTSEQVNKRATQSGGQFDRIFKEQFSVAKISEGDHQWRILPPTWPSAEHWGMDVFLHYGIGPDQQSYLCAEKMNGEPCPICEERQKADRDGDKDYAKQLNTSKRVVVWAVNRNAKGEGPVLWSMPYTLDKDISKLCIDKETGEVLAIDDPDDGFDIEFNKEGAKLQTRYTAVAIARKTTPLARDEEVMDTWLQFAVENPLPDALNYFDYDHIQSVFAGGHVASDDAEEKTIPARRSRKAAAETEDEEVGVEDEVEDKLPRHHNQPKYGKKAAEEDEEDEAGEDEEVEEKVAPAKPAQRPRARVSDETPNGATKPKTRPTAAPDEPDAKPAGTSLRDRIKQQLAAKK